VEALLSSAFGKPTASDISYGLIETMAEAVAAGAREAGVTVDIRRVPELVPDAVAASSHYKLNQKAPVATVEELPGYDAIIVGSGTRYGRMTSQMANFWDQTGGLWAQGHLIGKVGAAFTSTASQHGAARRPRSWASTANLLHHGMVIVGLPYSFHYSMHTSQKNQLYQQHSALTL